jgi:lysophospholipase L1-like esterase
MSSTTKPLVTNPQELSGGNPPPLSDYNRQLLAEGDSWFTLGSLNLLENSNLLFELQMQTRTAIVNCAYPGDTLQLMVDGMNDRDFDLLLRVVPFASTWAAIIVSAGGNDLIAAAGLPLRGIDGQPAPLADRLLLTPAEAAVLNPQAPAGARHVSDAGWSRLEGFLLDNFRALVSRRDQGPNEGRPLLLHTYAMPTVWAFGTVGASKGWLFPAFEMAGIAPADRQEVADELFDRLRQLLLSLDQGSGHVNALPAVHVFDSAGTVQLDPPHPTARSSSGDWVNEIHPNRRGYRKIGAAMGRWIDGLLG